MRASLKTAVAVLVTAATLAVAAASPAQAWDNWHRHGWGWGGPALAFGVLGAVVAANVASQNCVGYQPVYDRWGRYVGRRAVNVCY